ncbi:hypothetical protein B0H10DRAFT_1947734 [Mycena sp. CBHHK59/15]|nr:hypothetical protein B0H10DRAFT_1947734 [Mycena sp. CBHHK59/15]
MTVAKLGNRVVAYLVNNGGTMIPYVEECGSWLPGFTYLNMSLNECITMPPRKLPEPKPVTGPPSTKPIVTMTSRDLGNATDPIVTMMVAYIQVSRDPAQHGSRGWAGAQHKHHIALHLLVGPVEELLLCPDAPNIVAVQLTPQQPSHTHASIAASAAQRSSRPGACSNAVACFKDSSYCMHLRWEWGAHKLGRACRLLRYHLHGEDGNTREGEELGDEHGFWSYKG